jgi:NAD(P)H-flavin reductase
MYIIQMTSSLANIVNQLSARVHKVDRLTPTIVEVVLHAPQAARNFKPGQFFRLQNFAAAPKAMEPLAMTGAWVDEAKGLVSVIVLEMGGSSNLCAQLVQGEEVVLMGPTGTPTEIPANESVILCGGGLGNAVLFSIGKAMRANGCNVLYFAGYKKAEDRYKIEEIEAAADVVVWCCDEQKLSKHRQQDFSFKGNMLEAINQYFTNNQQPITSNHLIAIGSDRMMAAIAKFVRESGLFPSNMKAIGSINSPMQCMMKEICAQCLQRHVDPVTGAESYVYSCMNQDQELDFVDFAHLRTRLEQNTLHEKLTARVLSSSS